MEKAEKLLCLEALQNYYFNWLFHLIVLERNYN